MKGWRKLIWYTVELPARLVFIGPFAVVGWMGGLVSVKMISLKSPEKILADMPPELA